MIINQNKKAKSVGGFSLGELLVAMFVILVGIAGVTSSIFWATQKQDSGKIMTEANNHARVIFESIIERGYIAQAKTASAGSWPDGTAGLIDMSPTSRKPLQAPPFSEPDFQAQVTGQSGVSGVEEISSDTDRFTRNITLEQQAGTNAGVDDYLSGLALLTVTIYWREEGAERSISLKGLVTH